MGHDVSTVSGASGRVTSTLPRDARLRARIPESWWLPDRDETAPALSRTPVSARGPCSRFERLPVRGRCLKETRGRSSLTLSHPADSASARSLNPSLRQSDRRHGVFSLDFSPNVPAPPPRRRKRCDRVVKTRPPDALLPRDQLGRSCRPHYVPARSRVTSCSILKRMDRAGSGRCVRRGYAAYRLKKERRSGSNR